MAANGQHAQKWARIKKDMLERPFLAFKIGLTPEEVEVYFGEGRPSPQRILEIDQLLDQEQAKKIARMQPVLAKLVGPRGASQFAEKMGLDGMTIKYIIEGNSRLLGHDMISKIEVFLSYITDFIVSLENQQDTKYHIRLQANRLKLSTEKVATKLQSVLPYFDDLPVRDKKSKKVFGKYPGDDFKIRQLESTLKHSITALQEVQAELNDLVEHFIQ